MASGVNVKMGVSGISQFKQNMTQAKQSVKTLDAQLALTEKQFKASGDAESYMTEKTELLKAKLENQKSVLANAEKALAEMTKNGIDRSSKAYQDMYRQMVQAKGEILDTTVAIEGVETASDDAAGGIENMSTELNSIGKQVSFQTVTSGIESITDGLERAAIKAGQLAKAIFMATLDSASWADEVNEAAQKAGMSTKQYQQMAAAAQLVDTSIDSIIGSQQKLASAAEKDNKDMDEIFARLGVQKTRYGEVRDLNDLFWETGEALMKIENEADRADMGKKLFGQWRELIPMFEMGREEYEKLRDSQSYVDEEHMQSLQSLDDSYKTLQHEIDVLKNDFFAELAPSIQTVTDALSGLVQKLNEYLKTPEGKEKMQALGDNIEKLFSELTNFDPEDAINKIGDVLGGIRDAFSWIADNAEGIKWGLIAIAGGWAALKIATVGLKIGELVAGLSGLTLSSTASAAASAGATAGSSWATAFAAAAVKAVPWLIGLGIITKVSDTHDELGNNTLVDTNGNLTEEAKDYGFKTDEAGEIYHDPTAANPVFIDQEFAQWQQKQQEKNKALEVMAALTKEQKELAEEIYDNWNDDDKAVELLDKMEESLGSEKYKIFEDKIFELMQEGIWEGEDLPEDFFSGIEESLPEAAEVIGENTAVGFANGIDAKAPMVVNTAEKLAKEVKSVIEEALDIHSPSRVMERLGQFVSEGFAEGIESGMGRISDAVNGMAWAASSVRGQGNARSSRMIDVTLMLGPDKLTEVIVPLVDTTLGEEMNLMRR